MWNFTASVLRVAKIGDPILRHLAQPFTKEEILTNDTRSLIQNIIKTMQKEEALGLAAPQVHISKQLVITESTPTPNSPKFFFKSIFYNYERLPLLPRTFMFNPKLQVIGNEKIHVWEACISVPGYWGKVPRYSQAKVTYLDEKAQPKCIKATGYIAAILQHELDHLQGKLFVDHIKNFSSDFVFVDSIVEMLDKDPKLMDYDGGWEFVELD